MRIIGIDYSMASPAICIFSPENEFSPENCSFHFLNNSQKKFKNFSHKNIHGSSLENYSSPEERFDKISDWILNLLQENDKIFIEDYSFGSTGMIFNIAENCGILKHKLYKNNFSFEKIPPSTIKKFATNKGNANKELMYQHFIENYHLNLLEIFSKNTPQSPISDIVDAFFICKYGFEMLEK